MEHKGRVSLPATCGELVQGTLDGVRCLVSLPIDRFSTAVVELLPRTGWDVPPDATKAACALKLGLAHLNRPGAGGRLRLASSLPHGRGYGSSTADVGATLYALGRALEKDVPPAMAAMLAVRIEPSDSTLFPGMTLFAHRDACRFEVLGSAPPLVVLTLDPGGQVDTQTFNKSDHRDRLTKLRSAHREAFALLRHGLADRDWEAVGEAASLSAKVHQGILENPLLDDTMVLGQEIGALGVCRAHSGTLLGLLLDPANIDVPSAVSFVTRYVPFGVTARVYHIVNGGPQPEMITND